MLVAFEVAVELVGELRPVVAEMKAYDDHLAEEIRQAALRVVLYLAEGQRLGGSQRRAFHLAQGEVRGIRDGLERAARWGYVGDWSRAQRRLDRLASLTWGLSHARAA